MSQYLILRDLRRRRGRFASEAVARREIERLADALFPEDHLERRIFLGDALHRKPVKAIAAENNISERHVYRIRVQILERLTAHENSIQILPLATESERALESTYRRFQTGYVTSSKLGLDDILRSPMRRDIAAHAVALKARVEAELGNDEEAQRQLSRARSLVETSIASADHIEAEVATSESYIFYRKGRYREAIALAENGASDRTRSSDPARIRALVRRLIYLAILHEEGGTPQRSLDVLDRAASLLQMLPSAPAAEMAQIALHRAFAFVAIPGRFREAFASATDGLATAEWHGLAFETVWGRLATAWIALACGREAQAFPLARAALDAAPDTLDGEQLARVFLIASRVFVGNGRWRSALGLTKQGRAAASGHPWLTLVADIRTLAVLRAGGQLPTTISLASSCIERLEGLSESHYLGLPYLARAGALWAQGVNASADIERALHYFERGGMVSERIEALELSARMTRSSSHMRQARELRWALESHKQGLL